jgi:hypothetical protein
MTRLLVLTLLLVLPASAWAGMEHFRDNPRQVRLFAGGGEDLAEDDSAARWTFGLNAAGEITDPYFLITFGLSFGVPVSRRVQIMFQLDMGFAPVEEEVYMFALEVGPRYHAYRDGRLGAYLDARLALASYEVPELADATALGLYLGGGVEMGSRRARAFADVGARIMAPVDSESEARGISAQERERQTRDARRVASGQAMIRIGVRFYFR